VVANGPGDGASDVLRWYRREAPHPLTVVEESKPASAARGIADGGPRQAN
jgi:hypothetical protein